jgi:hypothetical protein
MNHHLSFRCYNQILSDRYQHVAQGKNDKPSLENFQNTLELNHSRARIKNIGRRIIMKIKNRKIRDSKT